MKKLLLAVLSAMCAASLTAAAAACTSKPEIKFEAPARPAEKSQELGSDFTIPSLSGKYGEETILPTVSVTFDGKAVETEAEGFRLDKVGEYTITYTFTYGEGETYTMTQKVISVDGVAPTVVMNSGGFVLYVMVNKEGGGECYDYVLYVDNIRIEKAAQTTNADTVLQTSLEEAFAGESEVVIQKVTDAQGAEVTLSEGKFTQSGTYTVEVLVKADGMNENTFTLTYNVTV